MQPRELSRTEWIDSARGIGILCVMLGHMSIPQLLSQFIFSFHMPLFFFLSGYLWKGRRDCAWFFGRIDRLVVPYVIYTLLFIGMRWYAFGDAPTRFLSELFHGNGLGPTWFFSCLFLTEAIGVCFCGRLGGGLVGSVFKIVLCGILGWLWIDSAWPNYGMSRVAFITASFWLAGNLFRRENLFERFSLLRKHSRAKILLAALFVWSFFWVQSPNLGYCVYGRFFVLFWSVAFAGTIATIAIVRMVAPDNGFLGFMGRNSLLFMCFHSLISPSVRRTFVILNWGDCPELLQKALSILLLFAVVLILSRHSLLLSGRARLFSVIGGYAWGRSGEIDH